MMENNDHVLKLDRARIDVWRFSRKALSLRDRVRVVLGRDSSGDIEVLVDYT
jgi:hypothetical protein